LIVSESFRRLTSKTRFQYPETASKADFRKLDLNSEMTPSEPFKLPLLSWRYIIGIRFDYSFNDKLFNRKT